MKTGIKAAAIGAAVLMLATSSQAAAEFPKESPDGLVLLEGRREGGVAVVYVRPGATLASYRRVMLDPVEVAFDKAWSPRPAVSASDRERIRRELADEFRKVFAEEIEKGGYAIAESAAPDVLRVRAALVDLYIQPPGVGTSEWSKTNVVVTSRVSLIGELRDAESGAILARVADRRKAEPPGGVPGTIKWTTRKANRAEARRVLQTWAGLLRTALDSARNAAP